MNLQVLMMKAVICSKKIYQKKQRLFHEEQQAVNEDENITADVDEPMDALLVKDYKPAIFLITFMQNLLFQSAVANNYEELEIIFTNI